MKKTIKLFGIGAIVLFLLATFTCITSAHEKIVVFPDGSEGVVDFGDQPPKIIQCDPYDPDKEVPSPLPGYDPEAYAEAYGRACGEIAFCMMSPILIFLIP